MAAAHEPTISTNQALVAAAIGGIVLWQGTAIATGEREAWDSALYWMAAYPLGLVLAAVLAYCHPDRPWRFALAMMLVQPVAMIAFSGSDFGLLPIGLIMFSVLAVPPIGVAAVVGAARRRKRG
jgi:hypothetical protein